LEPQIEGKMITQDQLEILQSLEDEEAFKSNVLKVFNSHTFSKEVKAKIV
jgi:hypothetical protein